MTALFSFLAISFCRKDHPLVVGAELAAETMRATVITNALKAAPIELQSGVCFEVRTDAPFQVREARH
jgi:hypothetical protein